MTEETKQTEENFSIEKMTDLEQKLIDLVEKNPEDKPTEEEVKVAGKIYDAATEEFNTKLWGIGTAEDAKVFLDFIQLFVDTRIFWTKHGWMGVIKMAEELVEAGALVDAGAPVTLSYHAMEFIFQAFQNPGGFGLQSAKTFEADKELFENIFDLIGKEILTAREMLKNLQFLQDQYTALQGGFRLEIEPKTEEDEAEVKEPELTIGKETE